MFFIKTQSDMKRLFFLF